MNKFLLLMVLLGGAACNGFAQSKPPAQLSIGGEFGFPAGKTASIYGSVIGGSIKLEVPVSQAPFYFTLTSGFSDYLVKLDLHGSASAALYSVPLEAGGKYYFGKIGYFEGDIGYSTRLSSNDATAKGALIFAPIIGFSAPTSKHKGTIDISLRGDCRVESGGTVGQIAARLAYRFGLGKR